MASNKENQNYGESENVRIANKDVAKFKKKIESEYSKGAILKIKIKHFL